MENRPAMEEVGPPENGPEIIEKFHLQRVAIAEKIGHKLRENPVMDKIITWSSDQAKAHPDISRAAYTFFNFSIGSYLTMTWDLMEGKTATGLEFNKAGKILQAISITSGLLQYLALFTGRLPEAAALKTVSWATFAALYTSDVVAPGFNGLSKLTEKAWPKGSAFFHSLAEHCDKTKVLFFKKPKNNEPRT